ncbi:ribonuclease HII [Candidatus Woesearchaeota archaeon]|nr:ribonuclease HII [Candidatus Woesearchaeota archaeon]
MKMKICGIDEAGRGPLIGPLVMCGVLIGEKDEAKLKAIGVKDSKLLLPEKREELFEKIKDIVKGFELIEIQPEEIDNAVNGKGGLNLNRLEARKSAEIINALNPEKAIIDAPSNNIEVYKGYFSKFVKNKKIKLVFEHKADFNYPVVAAASVLAKVTRDRAIESIKKKIRKDFGSGYMSDPKTVKFLEENIGRYPELFRKSWMPYMEMKGKKLQSKLDDFSKFIETAEEGNKSLKEKLKKLEEFGYRFIEAKTEHEELRMKGACTITLYKTGKLLIQGPEENRKVLERMLK